MSLCPASIYIIHPRREEVDGKGSISKDICSSGRTVNKGGEMEIQESRRENETIPWRERS